MWFKLAILIKTMTTWEYIYAHIWQMGAIFDLIKMIYKYTLYLKAACESWWQPA